MDIEVSWKKQPSSELFQEPIVDIPEKDDHKDDIAQKEQNLFIDCQSLLEWEKDTQYYNRLAMAEDEDYKHGKQWSDDEAEELIERGQHPGVYNEIHPTIEYMIGTEKRLRTTWRVAPRCKDDVEPAIRKTKLLRYLYDINRFAWHKSAAFSDACTSGLGWIEVGVRNDGPDLRIYQRRENWRNIYHDSMSVEPDYSDARYLHRVRVSDLDMAIKFLAANDPEKAERLRGQSMDFSTLSQQVLSQERLGNINGVRGIGAEAFTRQGVTLVETWVRRPEAMKIIRGDRFHGEAFDEKNSGHNEALRLGDIEVVDTVQMMPHVVIWCEGGLLHHEPSPYKHRRIPFVPIYAYRDSDGKPYGPVRQLKDPQFDINKRRGKSLFLLSTNQVIMEEGAVSDEDELAHEVAQPDGIIKHKVGKKLEIRDRANQAGIHLEIARQDGEFIREISGVNGEARGLNTNATSGKAIGLRADQGTTMTTTLYDNLRLGYQCIGELSLSLAEQYMTDEQEFRITGERGSPEFVKINAGDSISDIARYASDFVIDEADYRSSVRSALAEQLIQVAGMVTDPRQAMLLLDLGIEQMDIPNLENTLRRLREAAGIPDPDRPPEEVQAEKKQERQQAEQQEALQMRDIMAGILAKEAEASKVQASALREKLTAMREAIQTTGDAAVNSQILGMVDEMIAKIDPLLASQEQRDAQRQASMTQQAADMPLPDESQNSGAQDVPATQTGEQQ